MRRNDHRERLALGGVCWMLAAFGLGEPRAGAAEAVSAPSLQAPARQPLTQPHLEPAGEDSVGIPPATAEFFGRVVVPGEGAFEPRPPKDDLELQLALAQRRICPGSLDGMLGPQTRAALEAFQERHGLERTGVLDEATRRILRLEEPPLARMVVRAEDVALLRAHQASWLDRANADYLGYASLLEKVAELSQSHPRLIERLNGDLDWGRVRPGAVVTVPNTGLAPPPEKAAWIRISLGARRLQVFGERTNLVAHFPCSIGRVAHERPVGRLEVAAIADNPNYTFDPEVFPESEEGRRLGRKLIVPPGPNNPVGVAWIGLSREGYGIHGTPEPEKVGRTESHGCFRVANWNAAQLIGMVWVSMPVYVEP